MSGYGRQICYHFEYIGDYKEGRSHGQGTLVLRNGTTYEGAWENHKRHGLGKYTNQQGKVFEGVFVENHLNDVHWSDL